MKKSKRRTVLLGVTLVAAFVVWTLLIQNVDVQSVGQHGTDIGFATFNVWFHKLTGVHLAIYHITDWLGLVPVGICMVFAVWGFIQLIKRKSLIKVDKDILLLGVYYVIVILSYLIFEMAPINYRPILINGFLEASYPSSTTLLVLCVMPTLLFQVNKRAKNVSIKKIIGSCTIIFTAFMVVGRLISGVHWFTDIVGAILLSVGLFHIYKATVLLCSTEGK